MTSVIPPDQYAPITAADLRDATLAVHIGFRSDTGSRIEFRLCQVTDNTTRDAELCQAVQPLAVQNEADYQKYQTEAGTKNAVAVPHDTVYIPDSMSSSVRLRLNLSERARCDRCVLQVKYSPGMYTYTRLNCSLIYRLLYM